METLVLAIQIGLAFVVGACVGSFLNVVIYRLPAGLSLLHPPSRCPVCYTPLRPYDNVPVLGWLWLRGRCRHCQTPISLRYPLIEAATGLLFVGIFLRFGTWFPMLGFWLFVSWLIALSFIDLDTMTLPNPLTQSGLVLGIVFRGLLGWSLVGSGRDMAHALMNSILGAGLGVWMFTLIAVVGTLVLGQAAMGGGDAKLAAMMGAWLGWQDLLLASFLACAMGAFVGGGAIALGLISRRQPMPFGPFLALGAILTVFFGEFLLLGYQQLFFPSL
ncbi:prepilin peptidase [Leptolyngbya sp. AN02str]|uniref:prepilin peptidase n=1 Tax=Leptolyngbya sp. AN02str TaxID=3423363 RepID=UPI003D316C68